MAHPMAEQWMDWQSLETAPTDGRQILVGFKGQWGWYSYVADARGNDTGKHFAPPTHWTPIIPPQE